jgi:tungstate transport system substrate-binding protein
LVALIIALVTAASGCGGSADRVVIAAGTTVVDSGFMQTVVDEFVEAEGEGDFSVVGVASAEALALLDGEAAQLAVTHAPLLEDAYLGEHPDASATSVFTSRFLVVGPPGQEVVAPGSDAPAAFAAIAAAGATFVSRGDGSGTHGRELELWSLAELEPFGAPWYVETGQGMGFTLQVADQRDGFTLSEHGAYLASTDGLTVSPVPLSDQAVLDNPYRVLLDAASSDVARRFAAWLASPEGAAVVTRVNEELFGSVVYRPAP